MSIQYTAPGFEPTTFKYKYSIFGHFIFVVMSFIISIVSIALAAAVVVVVAEKRIFQKINCSLSCSNTIRHSDGEKNDPKMASN